MSKKILFILLLISSVNYAQLSNKHWIPPIHVRDGENMNITNNSFGIEHFLYLSTPEITPFAVTVTDGSGIPIAGSPFTISQGNPQSVAIGDIQPSVMLLSQADLNIPKSNKGLILKGDGNSEFYASFRMRALNHAEILVCKGIDGAGIAFRLGSLPMNQAGGVRNFMASFMATEDNTTVILSEYDTGVVFESLAGNITDDVQTFNLNAGESVTVSGYTDFSPNLTGFVGALLTSTKPIVVNTGNATGGMSTPTAGQDFNLDQIVPVNIVGDEYIVVKGNGSDLHERPLIIATQDNTQVFINGNTTAAATLLNAGDYFLVPSSFYSGTVNQNMFISSDKPVYLYQIIAGAISDATSGLNFIPPLSCFWQKNVDLIPNFNSIGSTNYPNSEIIVVTETGSTVSINNVPTTATPQLVTGNPNWVTYRINGLSGNVKIESTGALAAGVFGASGAAGFGGYYSGFGSLPRNTEVTVCSNETVNLFDAITGNPEPNGTWTIPTGAQPLNGNDFTGTINTPGDYIYTFSKICDNSNLVIPVTVTVNVEQAPFVGTNNLFSICKNDTSVDLFTLLGTGVTTGGTWSPALASGTGVFNPAIDVSGTYTYTIQGNAICPNVSATITVTNNDFPVITPISNFELCDDAADGNDTNGSVNFDLTLKNSEILGSQTGITVTYHLDPNEALNGQNAITNLNTSNRIIHVRLTNNVTGCFSTTSFNLVVKPLPIVNAVVALKQCDIDSDAVTDFNLTQANIKISTDATFVYSYHNSPLGALNNTDFVTNEIVFNAGNGSQVWARITNTLGCSRVAQVNLIVSATTIPQTYSYTIPACDDYLSASDPDNDGIDYFDLTEIEPLLLIQFPSGQSYTYSYYLNEADATAEQNPIINITNFRNTLPNNQTIWVRIESTLYECAGLGPFLKLVVNPLPFIDLGENFVLCIDAVTGLGSQTINATPSTPGSYSYQWTPTNPSGNSGLYNVTAAGTYAVVVTNTNTGCQFTDSVSVTTSSAPASLSVVLTTSAFSSGLATIEAIATGGFGIYEYSLNALDWQSSPIFSGLENGSYTVYARDIQGCDLLVSDAIQTITYPNYFTPNGDGYNDTWVIRLPSEYNGLITIYDRYGKLIKQISSYGAGWDGTFNGIALPSTDYWFKVEYTENNKRKEFKSHFSLKR
jgi:gliding motility-associated-like protein